MRKLLKYWFICRNWTGLEIQSQKEIRVYRLRVISRHAEGQSTGNAIL